ncbi:uncharacterized protein LOC126667529 [Mercurialis annua]|uniref:uncharacterized protein LOC126667529 n=1 Tax=Mercurialis annua TaxID=3986 RepID=UPI00215EB2A9|nr:uncharacterized protein LOC126667529 [Mercurialis annua]
MEGQESKYPNLYPKESLVKRYKLIWRVLLISNLGLGAYMFASARMKNLIIRDRRSTKKDAKDIPVLREDPLETATTPSIPETPYPTPAVVKPKDPIPEDQQRELFKWILEEKRKMKPRNPEEKKRIDEEKAILKQFIRAKSIPSG